MQLSENTIAGVVLFLLVQTGSLLWFLASIKGNVGVVGRDVRALRDHVKEQNGRISKAELRCARIHGFMGEDDQERG